MDGWAVVHRAPHKGLIRSPLNGPEVETLICQKTEGFDDRADVETNRMLERSGRICWPPQAAGPNGGQSLRFPVAPPGTHLTLAILPCVQC